MSSFNQEFWAIRKELVTSGKDRIFITNFLFQEILSSFTSVRGEKMCVFAMDWIILLIPF